MQRLDPGLLARCARLPTSSISDALDKLGIAGQVDGLRPMLAGARICGQALTLRYLPVGPAGGTVGDFLHLAEAGDVICIDNRARVDCTVWGNILTEAAKARGIVGTVIEGVNRDVGESRDYGYPIWSREPFAHWQGSRDAGRGERADRVRPCPRRSRRCDLRR